MKTSSSFIEKIVPDALKSSIDLGLDRRNYGHFGVILFTVMFTISLGPVVTIALLGYYNYKDLLQRDEHAQLVWQLDGSIRTIEQMVESLKSVVQFAAKRDRYSELVENDNLGNLFLRLKRQYPFFADLGVIDEHGVQRAYHGPYDLQGTNYSEELWLKETYDRGTYISRVYTGYRQVPHFAIAVSNFDPKTKKRWVLRATIDADTLQHFINTIKTDASDDLFLVDGDGYLQTSSEFFGKTLSKSNIGMILGVSVGISQDGENIFYAIGNIEGTPWSLILLKRKYVHQSDFLSFRARLFMIMMVCIMVSTFVILALVTLLTSLIRRADEIHFALMREAEHTDKLASIGRLAAGVGHEINNPLAIINQKTGLISDLLMISNDFEHKGEVENSLKIIDNSVERCKAITHRLLGFARRTEVKSEVLNLNEIVREVLQFLDNSMLYNRINLKLKLQDSLPQITSDRMQLQQIFLNILNNAIDAIGKDGVIIIETREANNRVEVVIEDNGIGIAEDLLNHIFEPFFTTKEVGKGTGLGLSITYGLVKKLGGDISVKSEVGKGTGFTLTIPIHREDNDRTDTREH